MAVDALYDEGIIRQPVDPGQILVRRRAPVVSPPFYRERLSRRHNPNKQVHHGIWPSGARVALFDHAHLVRLYVEAWYDIDRGFIHARIGDIAVVRAPPVTGETMHLFLRHELGNAIRDGLVRLRRWRQARLVAAGQVDRIQRALAHETRIAPFRRHFRVRFECVRLGQLADLLLPFAQAYQVQITPQRHQYRVGRAPAVIDNALGARDPLALAQRLFLFGEFCVVRLQQLRIDQPALNAGLNVELPEIQPVLLVRAALQEGHPLAVRRKLYAPWRRARQGRGGVQPLRRQCCCGIRQLGSPLAQARTLAPMALLSSRCLKIAQ